MAHWSERSCHLSLVVGMYMQHVRFGVNNAQHVLVPCDKRSENACSVALI